MTTPTEQFIHGWGPGMHNAKPTCAVWKLPVQQVDGSVAMFTFNLIEGQEPLIIGCDLTERSHIDNIHDLLHVSNANGSHNTFHTYFNDGESRRRLSVVPPPSIPSANGMKNSCSYLISSKDHISRIGPARFARRIHQYSHATAHEMKRICKMANVLDNELAIALENEVVACDICCRTGRPKRSRQVSITHIGSSFNQSVQVDFMFMKLRYTTRTILHMRDRGTGYSEIEVVPSRDLDDTAYVFDRVWISRHGAPVTVSGDQEFNREAFKRLLKKHDIKFEARPARRHNKLGSVERKNAVIRLILQRLELQCHDITMASLVARASFLSNLLSGSKFASSFEQVRGYSPGLCGLRHNVIPHDLIAAHQEQIANRAIHRMLSTKAPKLLTADALPSGTPIWAFLQSGTWEPLVVSSATPHYIVAKRNGKGKSLNIAYEDVRLAPRTKLNNAILSFELGNPNQPSTAAAEDLGGDEVIHGLDNSNPGSAEIIGTELPSPGNNNAVAALMVQHQNAECIAKDIGQVSSHNEPAHGTCMQSNEQHILQVILETIGPNQVSGSKLRFAPDWIISNSFARELDNWKDVYTEIPEHAVPTHANIVRSHTVFKVKTDESGKLSLKSRIVAHGNEDREKDSIRKDSAAAQFVVIRILLSLAAILGLRLAKIDVKKAYLQSGPISRDIYVRPPREWFTLSADNGNNRRRVLWKLEKLPYGIVEAGRQWHLVAENWILSKLKFTKVPGLSQIFVKRTDNKISHILVKVIDDFLIAGSLDVLNSFVIDARAQFEIGTVVVDDVIKFNGAEIVQADDGSIKLNMIEYCNRIEPIPLTRARRAQSDMQASKQELSSYQHLAGVLNFLGKGVLPHASYVASYMLQKIALLKVSGLVTANAMLREIAKLSPSLTFLAPERNNAPDAYLCTFSDASYNISSKQSYGQTGVFTGLAIPEGDVHAFHPLDWTSSKQRRVTYSSFGSEILACAEADDRTFCVRQALRYILHRPTLESHINVDSRGLFDTISTLHEGRDYRLRQTVQRIRDSFEARDFDVLRWIKGSLNVADALTKRNIVLYRLLNDICIDGRLHVDLKQGCNLKSSEWC